MKSDEARPAAYVCYLSLIGHSKHNNLYLFTPSTEVIRDFAAIQQHAARKFLKLGKGKVKLFACFLVYFFSFYIFLIIFFFWLYFLFILFFISFVCTILNSIYCIFILFFILFSFF